MPTRERHIDPNTVVRDFVSNGGGEQWAYGKFAKKLYPVADALSFYFFSQSTPDQLAIPTPLLAFARDDVRTLAHYKVNENPNGLKWEIAMNSLHLNRPFFSLCETLAHEMVHLYQESMADRKVAGIRTCRGGYHNKQFVEICEEIGLHPKLGEGYHVRPADGQIAKLLDAWCIAPPAPVVTPDSPKTDWWSFGAEKPKGTSTLLKYSPDKCLESKACTFRAGHDRIAVACSKEGCGGIFSPQ